MTITASFPTLRRALALFADLDWPVADRLLQRMVEEPGTALAMRHGLDLAAQDPRTDWSGLVANDSYELTDADDPRARDLVLDLIWDAVNPTEPPRDVEPASYRAYWHATPQTSAAPTPDFHGGADIDVRLENVRGREELARVGRIARVGNTLQVAYEPVQPHPLPATLRKLLRSALRELLRDTTAFDGATMIEFDDTKNRVKSKIAA